MELVVEAKQFAIEISGVGKRFTVNQGYRDLWPWRTKRTIDALQDVNLQIPKGEVFGILGANGAGKTTLFKILASLTLPSSGSCQVMGYDVADEPQRVKELLTYVVSEERSLMWRLTGRQNLHYFAALNNIPSKEAKESIRRLLACFDVRRCIRRMGRFGRVHRDLVAHRFRRLPRDLAPLETVGLPGVTCAFRLL